MKNFIFLFLIFSIYINRSKSIELDEEGRNVCFRNETKIKQVQVKYSYPIDVTTFKACLRFPFRCKKTRKEYRVGIRPENRTEIIRVKYCCDGYIQENEKCKPNCPNSCLHGECVSPNVCDCQPGYGGNGCNITCPTSKFGANCEYDCSCLTNPHCNKNYVGCSCNVGEITNECRNICKCKLGFCDPGLMGKNCDEPCKPGTFGTACIGKCMCVEQNTLTCVKENGNCLCKPNFYGIYCEHKCDGKLIHETPYSSRCIIESKEVTAKDYVTEATAPKEFNPDVSLGLQSPKSDLKSNHSLIFILIGLLIVSISISLLYLYKYKTKTKKLKRDFQNYCIRYSTGGSNDQFDNPVYSYATNSNLPSTYNSSSTYNNSIYAASSVMTLPHRPIQSNFIHPSLTVPRQPPRQNGYLNELSLVPIDLFAHKNRLADLTNPNLIKDNNYSAVNNIYSTIDEVKATKELKTNDLKNEKLINKFDDAFGLNEFKKTDQLSHKIPEDNDSVDFEFEQVINKSNKSIEKCSNNDFQTMHYDAPKSNSPNLKLNKKENDESNSNNLDTTSHYDAASHYDTLVSNNKLNFKKN